MIFNLDEQAVALYRNSRSAYHRGDIASAHEFYRRNRAENGVELWYEVELPDHLRLLHPIGTVLGRASYGDYLVAYHGCGVGSDLDCNRPTIGSGVVLFPGAKVLGKTVIGDNVFITANCVVQNCVVPSNVVVYPSMRITYCGGEPISSLGCSWRHTTRSVIKHFFP